MAAACLQLQHYQHRQNGLHWHCCWDRCCWKLHTCHFWHACTVLFLIVNHPCLGCLLFVDTKGWKRHISTTVDMLLTF